MTTATDLDRMLADIRAVDRRVLDAVAGLDDAGVAAASRLPGWTRGHVLAHLAGLGAGAARQLEHAAAGTERVDFYDGGRVARDAQIERDAPRPAAEHRAELAGTFDRVERAAAAVTPDLLDRPTGYRGRPVAAVLLMWWRELEVHVTDLDLGPSAADWTAALRAHLVEYLADRAPEGTRLDLAPTDVDERHAVGDGPDVVTVRGAAADLAAWLAGREPAGPLAAERDGVVVPLPELGPWP